MTGEGLSQDDRSEGSRFFDRLRMTVAGLSQDDRSEGSRFFATLRMTGGGGRIKGGDCQQRDFQV